MHDSLAPSTPANSFRAWLARAWADPESRSTVLGIVGVVIFYLLLWGVSPWLKVDQVLLPAKPQSAAKQFNIELTPESFAKPEPAKPAPPPFKFVETNPDAPENTPDKTQNFSDRNTQVAQEKPSDKVSDRPTTEGKKDFDTTQIISGQLTKPVEHIEAVPDPTPPQEQKVATIKAEQNPLSGFEKKTGDDKTAFGSNIAKFPANAQDIPEKVDGQKNVPLIQGATEMQPAIDPTKPRARPSLVSAPQARPAILADVIGGSQKMGLAYDAKWSNYGVYLKKLVDTVQIQWERILQESRVYPPSGTTVQVKFILDSEGRIARIVSVENQSSDQGGRACVSAITDRAPYGAWTDDMKAMLGDRQEMTFSFYYQ